MDVGTAADRTARRALRFMPNRITPAARRTPTGQPPCRDRMTAAALENAPRMRQRLVRRMQAPHQHADEGLVEAVPAARAELRQRLGREGDRRDGLRDDHVGAVRRSSGLGAR